MLGDFYDPEQHTHAQSIQHNFLACVAEIELRVLKSLHKKVLPLYRDLPTAETKSVGRILKATKGILESRPVEPWESPSAILASLTPTPNLTAFQAAFGDWYTHWNLPDAWAHDEALYRLSVWVLYPETEILAHPPRPDWSWRTKEARKQRGRIATMKRRANSNKLDEDDREFYEKEQRYLEKELDKQIKDMNKNKADVREKRRLRPRHRWLLFPRPNTKPPEEGVRGPMKPPKLDSFDELTERWTSYEERTIALLHQYRRDVYSRALEPSRCEPLPRKKGKKPFSRRELTGGLVPWSFTREGYKDQLRWVVQHQVMGRTCPEVAGMQRRENGRKGKTAHKPSDPYVTSAVSALMKKMGLTPRKTPGRRSSKVGDINPGSTGKALKR